jgi:hypothetical protein
MRYVVKIINEFFSNINLKLFVIITDQAFSEKLIVLRATLLIM